MVYVYNGILVIKKNKIMPFATTCLDVETKQKQTYRF